MRFNLGDALGESGARMAQANSRRQQLANVYRPVGPKPVQIGINAAPGQSPTVLNFDLSLPLEGLRLVYSGRVVIGGADYTSVKPQGLLNLLSNIRVSGTNTRQGGNVTLFDIPLAVLYNMKQMFGYREDSVLITVGAGAQTLDPIPSTPLGTSAFIKTQGTYDYRIVVDLPFFPFKSNLGHRPGFYVRQQEWKDSLQLQLTFPAVPDAAQNPLGVSAGASTSTFTAFGSGAGTPTLDVYSLPAIMGLDLAPTVIPGFCTRVQQPVSTPLQSAGNNIQLLQLQKQATSRIFLMSGVSTQAPGFSSVNDTNVTALGVTLGGNRYVRNSVDIYAHKLDMVRQYDRDQIQGMVAFDFMQSGLSRSAFPGDQIGDGSTFQLIANVTGLANAYGIVVQEQLLYQPEGAFYTV